MKKKSKKMSMINSMTGFGKASLNSPYGKITVEVKTLNHKSLSIVCNQFNDLFLLEEQIKKAVEDKVHRGKVFIKISCENTLAKKPLREIIVNEAVAAEYLSKVNILKKKLGVEKGLSMRDLISLPGVVDNSAGDKSDELWKYIKSALEKAVEELLIYRRKEGSELAKDVNNRLDVIGKHVKDIAKYSGECVENYRGKLIQSIKNVAEKQENDKRKLEEEVASFAKNCDIAEEIARLEGHLGAFRESVHNVKIDAGKKLDFIAQEMQREANTIGAKSSDFRIAKAVIEVKSEIEKIREQIKNIE